jgi:hypothetical protein
MATSHNLERMVVGEADLRRAADQAPAADPDVRAPRPAKRRAPEPPPEPKPAKAAEAPAESKEDAS